MDTNEIKLDLRNQISAIDQTFPRHWGKSFNQAIRDKNITTLESALVGISQKFKTYKLLVIIALSFLIGVLLVSIIFLAIKVFQGIDLVVLFNCGKFLNINSYTGLFLPSLICLMLTFRMNTVKSNLEKKIILIRLLDIMEKM